MTAHDKENRKLLNDVAETMKVLSEHSYSNQNKIRVDYNLREQVVYIYYPPDVKYTGNGYERVYGWQLLEKLIPMFLKKNISYKIGLTDSSELHIQIYI